MMVTRSIYKLPLWARYAAPFLGVAIGVALRFQMTDWLDSRYPITIFLIPITVIAWFAGLGPGLLTIILSIVAGMILPKPYSLLIDVDHGYERIILFLVVAIFCTLLIARLRITQYRVLENEEKLQGEILDRQKVEDELRTEVATRIRAEKALSESLQRAVKVSSYKGDFLANMSHEIRTPLNAVVGIANILSMTPSPTAKYQELISTLKLSADGLLALINDILDIAKMESGSVEVELIPFHLTHLIEEVLSVMNLKAKEKGLELSMDASKLKHTTFIGDPMRIRQIVMNLCSNAIKFTQTGSVKIDLTTSILTQDLDLLRLKVIDTGMGIPPDRMNSIFEKFVQGDKSITRKFGGSGLGLALVKALTKNMGGTVSAESVYGKGATFTVTIPLRKSAEPLVEETTKRPNLPPKLVVDDKNHTLDKADKFKVLLVEDNPANVMVASAFLEDFGFDFDHAADGLEAVRKFQDSDYFAILMDVQMPNLNGVDATRRIRAYERNEGRKRIRIIGMTAYAMPGDRERCLECGMDDYLAKPFDPEVLESKLKKYIPIDKIEVKNQRSTAFR